MSLVTIGQEVMTKLGMAWRYSVVIKLLGRSVAYQILEIRLREMWLKLGRITIMDLANGFSVVHFEHENDLWVALTRGSQSIFGHYLMVKKCDPPFNPRKEDISTICTWVRFSNLPIIFYEERIIFRIVESEGCPLKVDRNTLQVTRSKFTRVCVKLDQRNLLRGAILVNGEMVPTKGSTKFVSCAECTTI